jgi:hypothetical protein
VKLRDDKVLLVEGRNDLYTVWGIMQAFIPWPDDEPPVSIRDRGSVEAVLDPDRLRALINSSKTRALGVMVDANTRLVERYRSFRQTCLSHFPDIPERIPREGLVVSNAGQRLGLWMMPDNGSDGYLEGFLAGLVPVSSQSLWAHAVESANKAKVELGAPYLDAHSAKARFYTWLAWQDTPGRPPGETIKKGHLDARAPSARAFVEWFLRLYQLEPRAVA